MSFISLQRSQSTQSNVLVIGGVSYDSIIYLDHFPEPRSQTVYSSNFHETIGSTGAGKALNLCRLGIATTLHSLIGNDRYGDFIRNSLTKQGIHFLFDIDPHGTERHVNLMENDGGRISIYVAYSTPDPVIQQEPIEKAVSIADVVALNINNYCRRFIPVIKAKQKEIWCDIHDYDGTNPYHHDFIRAADVLFLSSDAMPDFRSFMKQMISEGKKQVVCTHGRKGATTLSVEGEWIETPILDQYKREDTNGAGDSFFSGVLYGYLSGYPIQKSLQIGTIVSGLCISSRELANPLLNSKLVEREYAKYYG